MDRTAREIADDHVFSAFKMLKTAHPEMEGLVCVIGEQDDDTIVSMYKMISKDLVALLKEIGVEPEEQDR